MSVSYFSIAQINSATVSKKPAENPVTDIYTSIKPADGNPVIFSSQEELESKIQSKKDNILGMIRQNASDTAKVRYLRQELWRFENAIVKKTN
jgi:hypothetical protein